MSRKREPSLSSTGRVYTNNPMVAADRLGMTDRPPEWETAERAPQYPNSRPPRSTKPRKSKRIKKRSK